MVQQTVDKVLDYFRGRKMAYARVFETKGKYTQEVLIDLAKFCRAHESAFHPDPRMHAVIEGRREVWLRIQNFLGLSEQELMDLHSIKNKEK